MDHCGKLSVVTSRCEDYGDKKTREKPQRDEMKKISIALAGWKAFLCRRGMFGGGKAKLNTEKAFPT